MGKGRLEAFSDGVIAIIITIMVLELKVPHGAEFEALAPLFPVFLSYVLSFIYVGIYWNNHHHLIHAVTRTSGGVLWANLHLLFWLSLIPFVTSWIGEHHFAAVPLACYGFVLFMSSFAYLILVRCLEANNEAVKAALGSDRKGKVSMLLYLVGVALSFFYPLLGFAMYVLVAVIWFLPDRRIESRYKS
ncbi:putative membrane protein [Duganella sp. SG902]|uniref:TMEM175 family protein n=1 Tax=Duganella sp. SG902 TaxID=2587016 RepID=UPI00159DC7AC|nr:TMEM175 family protein [Duganella sp. SG902]NVM77017.1 putative membrane protein [Duganella sp. SG902]